MDTEGGRKAITEAFAATELLTENARLYVRKAG
jgi:hypothetical protein